MDKFPDDPIAPDAQFKKLECLYKLGEYVELEQGLLAFKKQYPKNSTYTSLVHFLLAECRFFTSNYQQALDAYQMVLNSKPDKKISFFSQLGLARCRLELKQYDETQELLENITAENLPDDQQEAFLILKADLFMELKDFSSALAVWPKLQKIAVEPETKMRAFLGNGAALYNLGQYREAIGIYQQAKAISVSLSDELLDELHYELAWAFLKNGQFKEAIAEFQQAASYATDEMYKVAALCQMGDVYQDAQEYQKAIDVYDGILTKYPDTFYVDYAQYQLGFACLRLSKHEEAILAFQALLQNFPETKLKSQAIYFLSLGLFQNQDYRLAQETLQKYLPELKDKDLYIEALFILATSFYNLGEFAQAMNTFKRIIPQAHNKDIGLIQKAEYEIADCLYQLGKEKEALQKFKILRAKYPDSNLTPEITWWLGGYYSRKGNFNLARRYFSALIKDFPESALVADGYYAIGLLDQEEDKLDSALESLRKAMKLGSKNLAVQASIVIADILFQQEKFDESQALYEQVINGAPELSGLIYVKISRIYQSRGEFTRAIRLLRQAVSSASTKEAVKLQFKIARLYENKGDYSQAVEEYLKIPYLYPVDSRLIVKAYLDSAQIYENQDDFLKAKDIYLKVASMKVEEAKYAVERLEWIEEQIKLRSK